MFLINITKSHILFFNVTGGYVPNILFFIYFIRVPNGAFDSRKNFSFPEKFSKENENLEIPFGSINFQKFSKKNFHFLKSYVR